MYKKKKTLLKTFSISHKRLQVLQSNIKNNIFSSKDQCGQHHNQTHSLNNVAAIIRDYINSFLQQDCHYSRTKSQKEILSPDMSLVKIYRAFTEKYPDIAISHTMYQTVFHNTNL